MVEQLIESGHTRNSYFIKIVEGIIQENKKINPGMAAIQPNLSDVSLKINSHIYKHCRL